VFVLSKYDIIAGSFGDEDAMWLEAVEDFLVVSMEAIASFVRGEKIKYFPGRSMASSFMRLKAASRSRDVQVD
jgi:hypothetical protein